ncbi:integrase domain-containing protein [Caballeronia grimmiae]|uniref:integrase domain-containing protein n=1 Tax=Caballeronia grimmiae TaxID=1071679 RepID=UPI0038B6C869
MSVTVNVRSELRRYNLPEDFKIELERLLDDNVARVHSRTRVSKKTLSLKTQAYRIQKICHAFVELRENGYALKSPWALKQKHVEALVDIWVRKKLTGGTIENKLTYLRALAEWMHKPNLIGPLESYVDRKEHGLVRSYIATEDKSWEGNGVDSIEKMAEIAHTDKYVAVQLRLQLTFGLRVEESFLLRPLESVGDDGMLRVTRGTKGGRNRVVPIGDGLDVLKEAAALINPVSKTTIPLGYTKQQWKYRFYRVLRKHGVRKSALGITAHGLRHQNFHTMYEALAGVKAPVKGTGEIAPKEQHEEARRQVVEAAGHSRPSIANAYLSTHRVQQQKAPDVTFDQVCDAIAKFNGNKKAAANFLQISRQSVYRILERSRECANAKRPGLSHAENL